MLEQIFQFDNACVWLATLFGVWLSSTTFIAEKILADRASCGELGMFIEKFAWGDRYRAFLNRALDEIDEKLGGNSNQGKAVFTSKSFEFCLVLAFCYPILSFVWAWLFGAPGAMGEMKLLPHYWPVWKRILLVTVLCGYWALCFHLFRRAHEKYTRTSSALAFTFAFAGALGFAVAGTEVVAQIGIFEGAGVNVGVLAFAGAFAVSRVGGFIFAFAFAGAVICALASAGALAFAVALTFAVAEFLLFFIALPWCNAFFDWISLGISRRLLSHLREPEAVWWQGFMKGVGFVIADVFLAFCFLFLLAVSLPLVVELVGFGKVGWRDFLETAVSDPWGDGLMVTVMLFTTLIPTALHLIAVVASTLLSPQPFRQGIVDRLRQETADGMPHKLSRYIASSWLVAVVIVSAILAVGFLAGVPWLLGYFGHPLGPLLHDIALASGNATAYLLGH